MEGDTDFKNFWNDNVASPVEQGVRGLFGYSAGETVGDFLKPSALTRDGKVTSPDNKIYNNKSREELNQFITENVRPSKDPTARHLYKLRNPVTEEIKWGTSQGSAQQRYDSDPEFNNWIVEYDSPTDNAEDIENKIHGNSNSIDNNFANPNVKRGVSPKGYAMAGGTLQDGNSERYKAQLFDAASSQVSTLLDPEQQALTSSMLKSTGQEVDTSKLSIEDYTKSLQKKDSNTGLFGSLSTSGSGTLQELAKAPQFNQEAKTALAWFDDNLNVDNMSNEDVAKQFQSLASDYNWNMAKQAMITSKIMDKDVPVRAKQAMLNALEMYETTDTRLSQFGEGLGNVATDPTSYLGLSTFGVGTAGAQVAKQGMKAGLKKAIAIAGTEGAIYSGAYDAGRQQLETQSERQDGYDVGRGAVATGAGAVLGGVLGGLIQGIYNKVSLNSAKKALEDDAVRAQAIKEMNENTELAQQAKAIGLIDDSFPFFQKQEPKTREGAPMSNEEKLMDEEAQFYNEPSSEQPRKMAEESQNTEQDIAKAQAKQLIKEQLSMRTKKDSPLSEEEMMLDFQSRFYDEPKDKWEKDNLAPKDNRWLQNFYGKIVRGDKVRKSSRDKYMRLMEEQLTTRQLRKRGRRKVEKDDIPVGGSEDVHQVKLDNEKRYRKEDREGEYYRDSDVEEENRRYQEELDREADEMFPTDTPEPTKKSVQKEDLKPQDDYKLLAKDYAQEPVETLRKDMRNDGYRTRDIKEVERLIKDNSAGTRHTVKLQKGKSTVNKKTQRNKKGQIKKDDAVRKYRNVDRTTIEKVVDSRKAEELPSNVPKKYNYLAGNMNEDHRARAYQEDLSLLSAQGKGQASSLAIEKADLRTIKGVVSHMNKLLETYDNNVKLRETYGQIQTAYKGVPKVVGKSQQRSERKAFIRDMGYLLSEHLSADDKKQYLKRIKRMKVPRYYPVDLPKIKKKYDAQFDGVFMSEGKYGEYSADKRMIFQKKHRTEQLHRLQKLFDKNKDKFEKQYIEDLKEAATKANREAQETEAKTNMKGEAFDYESGVQDIDTYSKMVEDWNAYESGELTGPELWDRNKARLDSENFTNGRKDFETIQDFQNWIIAQNDRRIAYGLKPEYADKLENKVKKDLTFEQLAFADEASRIRNTVNYESKIKSLKQNGGKEKLEKQLLEAGFPTEDIAWIKAPPVPNRLLYDTRAEVKESMIKELNDRLRKELGITPESSFKTAEETYHSDTMLDFSNSVGQNVALIMGDKDIADLTKLTGKTDDLRQKIADHINSLNIFSQKILKDDIKPIFMQQMYGQLEKGSIREADKVLKGQGEALFKAYDLALKEYAPSIYKLTNTIYELGKKSDGTIKYTLPDGVKIEFDLKAKDKLEIKRSDSVNTKISIEQNKYDADSRALMPNLMHSIDGYVMRRIVNRLFDELNIQSKTNHDAIKIMSENTKAVQRITKEVQQELNDSNILHGIMTQLGYTGKPIKVGTLSSKDIENSLGKALDVEHSQTMKAEIAKRNQSDNSRVLTDEELMKEYMATGNYMGTDWNVYVDSMVNISGYNSTIYNAPRPTDNPYERAMVEAMTGETQEPVMPPKGVDEDVWFDTHEKLVEEARAKAEKNPMLRDVIQGKRHYFDKEGNWLGSGRKTSMREMVDAEETRIIEQWMKDSSEETRLIAKEICGL